MIQRLFLLPLIFAVSAHAQVVNGDFETGSLLPWVVTPTAQGHTIVSAISMYDIDGPGPLPVSRVAQFLVGRNGAGMGLEGITLSQSIPLSAGLTYTLSFNWSIHAFVNVYNSGGGNFELLIDGVPLNHYAAPVIPQNQSAYGQVSATFQPPQSGAYTLGIRITRTVPAGEEVFQYIDNVVASIPCYPNCDGSAIAPILNVSDFICFLNRYAAGEPYANCDLSSTPPILNVNDFTCFLNRYAAGCS